MTSVRLVGSRVEGRSHGLSDWDLSVETKDFEQVTQDLQELFAPLEPIAQQWDPYASHACYMLMFPGPTKVDLLFLDEPREWLPAWEVRVDTLAAIDRHFWDWILWLEQKRRGGYEERIGEVLKDLYELMLQPMGVAVSPTSVPEALAAYLGARSRLEKEFGTKVPRQLEEEVRPVIGS